MSIGRISTSSLSDQVINNLQSNLQTLSTTQEQISSGQNINEPSDNPVGLSQLLQVSNSMSADTQYTTNINTALSELNTADSAMTSMTNLISQAQELATEGANTPTGTAGMSALAVQVGGIVNQMVALGNTNIGGKYIFAGMDTNTPPFAQTGSNVAYSGTPPTQSYGRTVEISENTTATINVDGQTLLGSVTTAGSPAAVTGGSGVFQTLTALQLALQQGSVSGVSAQLSNLTTALNTVSAQQAQLGSVTDTLNLTQNRLSDQQTTLTQQYDSIQSVNMAQAVSNLNTEQTVYQASLGVAARILQTSLLNYLSATG